MYIDDKYLPKLTDTKINQNTGLQLKEFDTSLFEKQIEIITSNLKDYLNDTRIKGIDLIEPKQLMEKAIQLMNSTDEINSENKLEQIIQLFIETGIKVHSPGYMGRQFSGVIPLSGIVDFVSAMVNQPSSFYEAAQLPNIAEKIMADEFNKFIKWPTDRFTMVSTSGGSLANLTAILAARNCKLADVWENGMNNYANTPAIAISSDIHYSISRAAGILGIGSQQIVKLPINENCQIELSKVQGKLDEAKSRNLNVFCMVASAGNTSMGAIDPLGELAVIAETNNIWFHVDAAHGGALLVSDKQREKLKGLNMADSFVIDAHKMLFVPSLCTLLFYKNKKHAYNAFKQQASYVFEEEPDAYTAYDAAEKNFECTKRPTIMNLWVCWAMYGKKLFEKKVDYLCELTNQAYQYLQNQPDVEVIHQPEINILCFRYTPQNTSIPHIKDLQLEIRNKIKEDGKFFISKVEVQGETALRVVFMNHKIELHHFRLLLNEIRTTAIEIVKQYSIENNKITV